MLSKINLKNFKCFQKPQKFPFKQINLLTGTNGRGKSTLLQSILLMRQYFNFNSFTNELILNGDCVRLGNFQDIKNSNAASKEAIIMQYEFKNTMFNFLSKKYYEYKDVFEYSFVENIEDDMTAKIDEVLYSLVINSNFEYQEKLNLNQTDSNPKQQIMLLSFLSSEIPKKRNKILSEISSIDVKEVIHKSRDMLWYFKYIHYIAADRIGPQDFYLRNDLGDFPNVGAKGENTINLLYKKAEEVVNPALCLGDDAQTLLTQTEEWLNYIFDGAKLEIPKSRIIVLEPLFNTNLSKYRYKASNIGFGYSYILPIIVSGLIAKSGETLIVENPEAHLHPKAQSRLTKFLAKVSELGVQVFIESHSDHILNALRIAVLDNIITSYQANILYFPQEIGEPIVQITIQPDGKIEQWPAGFFDQMDKDFERLFGV